MMLPLDQLKEECRTRGVKLTVQRVAIFKCLQHRLDHPTAEDVYQEVRQLHPGLSFATVYNTLELLTQMGAVREIVVDELRRRYDVNAAPHQHAVCRGCHRILDVPMDHGATLQRLLGETDLRPYDFLADGATIEFTGFCGACVRAAGSSPLADRSPLSS
jgi:Fur family peroxide stress response transcriptional regulator